MEQKFVIVPFDIEKAKQITNKEIEGEIVTRDGRNVRVVCLDKKDSYFPIVALVSNGGTENVEEYNNSGRYSEESIDGIDLMLKLPEYLTFKDGDVLTCKGNICSDYECIFIFKKGGIKTNFYSCIRSDVKKIYFNSFVMVDSSLKYLRISTEDEKQKLIEALQASDDKRAVDCLKKLGIEVKPKCEFTTGQPVIGVDGRGEWRYDLFSHYKPEQQNGEYVCTGRSYKKILPFNEKNAVLLGKNTTNMIKY